MIGKRDIDNDNTIPVMLGLVPGIHDLTVWLMLKSWMAGTSPAMTRIMVMGRSRLARTS